MTDIAGYVGMTLRVIISVSVEEADMEKGHQWGDAQGVYGLISAAAHEKAHRVLDNSEITWIDWVECVTDEVIVDLGDGCSIEALPALRERMTHG